jgi:hypothetical protein
LSLGVVVYELLCPPPRFEERYKSSGTAWAEKLIKKFEKDLEERPDDGRLAQYLVSDTRYAPVPVSWAWNSWQR